MTMLRERVEGELTTEPQLLVRRARAPFLRTQIEHGNLLYHFQKPAAESGRADLRLWARLQSCCGFERRLAMLGGWGDRRMGRIDTQLLLERVKNVCVSNADPALETGDLPPLPRESEAMYNPATERHGQVKMSPARLGRMSTGARYCACQFPKQDGNDSAIRDYQDGIGHPSHAAVSKKERDIPLGAAMG